MDVYIQERSERMEYDFMRANNLTTTTAPFATNHTPQIGIKIIGSKRVPVIENLNTMEDRQNSPGGYGPRVPPIQNIAENPTKIDPRLLAEGTKGYFSAQRPGSNNIEYGERQKELQYFRHNVDNFSSNIQGKPTFANRTRPDSKTLSPYNNLPPIRANEQDQMSTVLRAAPHPDTLRLIASMFIDPSIPGQVNYEKILKFIEYAMKRNYPDLFTKTQDGLHGLEPFKEKETAKLLRMVHDALNETGYRLDIERLYRDFQSVDNKRETLSKAQISDVLYQNRVPLQDSLLDHILHKFQQSNGQYNWQQFLSFLEKVQSVQTGLPIPQSKRPLEYAKQYPPPHDSWPRAKESPRESPPPSNRNGYDSNDYREPPLTERERRMLEKLRKTEEAINGLKHRYKDRSPSPVHYHESETERERRVKAKINQIEDEIYELKFKDQESQPQNGIDKENKEKRILDQISKTRNTIDDIKITNQIMREGMEVSEKGYNWSDKLLKLSGQLYAIDEQRGRSEGLIPYQVMIDKTMEFNKYAHMDIPYDVIVRLAQEYKNQRDQVDIFKFLDHLGNRYRWYKA
ncbi:Hypothetical predicted protein [Mytilus galloprovincialis]|uniref:DUF5580 domain-containing protein n=1 Tax=Mytilus galloprovincialis TaxID=29158 RepID=A0A8B6HJE2_MYTGA|nr:Hypothetical predicted protein [Mytilus galloprovincialis]